MNRLPRVIAWMFPRNEEIIRHVPPPPFPQGRDRSKYSTTSGGPASDASPRRHVLFLRTFESDHETKVGNPKLRDHYKKVTIEEVLGKVAKEFQLPVQLLRDPSKQTVARSLNAFDSSDDDWYDAIQGFIRSATCAVAFSSTPFDIDDGFGRELRALRESRLRDRTIIICPPHMEAERHDLKRDIFTALGWPVPSLMPLVAWRSERGPGGVVPSLGREDDSLRNRYEHGIRTALTDITSRG